MPYNNLIVKQENTSREIKRAGMTLLALLVEANSSLLCQNVWTSTQRAICRNLEEEPLQTQYVTELPDDFHIPASLTFSGNATATVSPLRLKITALQPSVVFTS